MPIDKLTRIRQLIALSASDQIEEARNAAYQACKMIREGNVTLVIKAPEKNHLDDIFTEAVHRTAADRSSPGPFRSSRPPTSAADVETFLDDLFRSVGIPRPPETKDPHPPAYRYASASYGNASASYGNAPPRVVLNPSVPEGKWTFCPLALKSTWECDGCARLIHRGVEAWHSRYEIRCQTCSPGPVGEVFSKQRGR